MHICRNFKNYLFSERPLDNQPLLVEPLNMLDALAILNLQVENRHSRTLSDTRLMALLSIDILPLNIEIYFTDH
jgi:hypothetical protein